MTVMQARYEPEREQNSEATTAYDRLTRIRKARDTVGKFQPAWSMYVEHAITREEYGRLTGRW